MIPIPRSVYIALAIVLVVFGIYRYGHHVGWDERDQEMQAEIAKKNEQSRAIEQQLTEQISNTSTQLKEANDAVSKKQFDLERAIRAGSVRLPSSSCVQTSSNAAPTSGNSNEATGESDRETLRLIAQIAADGDKNTNQLNACIDAYNKVREQINGQR